MADIDDVMNKLDDVLDKVADNKEKIDEVLAKDEIWMICTLCKGTGEINIQHAPEVIEPCPDCNATGKYKWGKTDTPA